MASTGDWLAKSTSLYYKLLRCYSSAMFEVLVYLYETYYRPDAFPEPAILAKTLSDIGFRETEITDALVWLTDLAETNQDFAISYPQQTAFSFGLRIYAEVEQSVLGVAAIGFIRYLEAAQLLNPIQREIVIERALAADESPMPLDKLRLIVLVVLWSQGEEPDALMVDTLFPTGNEVLEPRLLH